MPKLFKKTRIPGTRSYVYLLCQRCGKPKGRSGHKLCLSCGHYKPKKGLIDIKCPHCGNQLSRDELIITLYWAGVGSDTLGKVFGITKQRILQITRAKREAPSVLAHTEAPV